MTNDNERKQLAIRVLRAADDERPVWEAGLDEIVDAVLDFYRSDPSTCDNCGGKTWHHTVECFTGPES